MGNTQIGTSRTCLRFLMNKLFQTKFSRLITAIKQGNLSLVKSFFKEKVNFNEYLQNGDTPLHIAVKYNKLEIVKFICDHVSHLNLNDKNFAGDTPLMLAVMDGNLKIVEYLILRKFADVDLPENRGFTPFMAACAHGNLTLVKFLVKNGCNYRAKAKDGQTGLHRAAFYGNVDILRYLIKELKMNVLLPDRKGNLPLHLACMKLKITCIRILSRASNKSTRELLHTENKYGVKPIDLLVKLLNRMRRYDETIDFEAEQIVEYIKDKRNIPTFKRLIGPTSTHKSLVIDKTDIFKSSKKATTFSNHDVILIGDSPLLRPQAMPMSELDPVDAISPTEERPKETEEEELIKYTHTDTIPDTPLMIPLSGLRGSSFASPDLSPASFTIRTDKRLSTTSKVGRPILRTTTKFSEQSLSRTITIHDRASFLSSADDAKAILSQFAPSNPRKSKFAAPAGSSQEALAKDGKGSNVSFS